MQFCFHFLIVLAVVGGLIRSGSQSKFIPYVVKVDKLGQTIAAPRNPPVHRQKDKGRDGA